MPEAKTATHTEPVWRDRSDYIIRVDLSEYGMPGSFEQLWTRRAEGGGFEVCCIPYFTYGVALGDLVEWTEDTHRLEVRRKSGRRNLRIAFHDRNDATEEHEQLHGAIVQTGCLVEFSASGYAAVDVATDDQRDAVLAVLDPYVAAERLIWEWVTSPHNWLRSRTNMTLTRLQR